jgi:predicted lipoprotein with Yx(FWY)xxD motif
VIPAGGIGIDVSAARITPRRDGGNQVTYKGHPLYHYAGDKDDRDAGGQGLDLFGGEWHVLTKDGQPLA